MATNSSNAKLPRPLTPQVKERTVQTHERIMQTIAEKSSQSTSPCRVLLLGDSMLERWQTTGKHIWVRNGMNKYGIINAGVGGDGTQHVLWRLQNGLMDSSQPETVIILVGTNNIERDKEQDICDAVKLIVEHVKSRVPEAQVVLYGVLPRGDKKNADKINRKIDTLNAMLSTQIPNVRYRYFGDKFKTQSGQWDQHYFDDHVHLNETAHEIYIKELLKDIGQE